MCQAQRWSPQMWYEAQGEGVYAQGGLSLRAGPECPLHAGDEQGHDVLLGLLATGLSTVLQVSDAEWPLHAPVALQVFICVCLLFKRQRLRSCWARETLCISVVRRSVVYCLFFKSKMRSERQLACSQTFREKMAPKLLSWPKKWSSAKPQFPMVIAQAAFTLILRNGDCKGCSDLHDTQTYFALLD